MGVVYCACDTELGRYVALKVLLASIHASDGSRKPLVGTPVAPPHFSLFGSLIRGVVLL